MYDLANLKKPPILGKNAPAAMKAFEGPSSLMARCPQRPRS